MFSRLTAPLDRLRSSGSLKGIWNDTHAQTFDNIKNAVSAYNFSDTEVRAALGGAHSTILASGDRALQGLVLEAIAATLRDIWVLTIAAGAVALVSGVLMKREKLNLEMTAGG